MTPSSGTLREQDAFLALAETLSALITLIQGDKIVYVNPAACSILGYPRDHFVGRNFWEAVALEDRDAARERGRARQAGIPQPKRFLERLRHADGHDVWLDYSVDLIRLDGVLTTLVTGHDVTDRKQMEEQLKWAFTHAVTAKAIFDLDGRFVRVNHALQELLGYAEEELLATNDMALTHPDDIARTALVVSKLFSGEMSTSTFEKRYLRKDGRPVQLMTTFTLVRDPQGKPLHSVGEMVDVTARRAAEEALGASEERFRLAFENAAIGKGMATPDLRFLQINQAICRMLGYTKEELMALGPVRITPPEDMEAGRQFVLGLLSGERSSGRMVRRYIHKDGHYVWGDLTTTLIRDKDGKPAYFVSEIIDITERKKAEELLRDREGKLAEAQRVAHVGSWDYDVVANTSLWSDEMYRIFGVEPGSSNLSRESAMTWFHPDDRPRIGELVDRAIREGAGFQFEARVVRPNGDVRSIDCIGRVGHDAAGKVVRLYGVLQDITDRKQAENLLRDREAKLAQAQDLAGLGSWEWDLVGGTLLWSDELYRIVGVERDRFAPSYEDYMSRVHPDDRTAVTQLVERALQDGKPFENEHRLVRPDGVRTLWSSCRTDLDPSGKPARMYGVVQDITDRKRAEELLRDREAKLAEAQRVAHVGSWEHDIAKNLSTWSDEVYRIAGLDPATFVPTIESALARAHPGDLGRITAIVERSIREGTSYEEEIRIVRPDGEVRTILCIGRAELDKAGKPIRLYGVFQDITERKRAEDALKASEQRFRSLYTQSPFMMIALDRELKIKEVSNYWLKTMGYDRAEVVGRDGHAFLTPESREKLRHEEATPTTRHGLGLVSRNVPLQALRKDGTKLDLLVTSVFETDDQGRILGALSVAVDVTDFKRAENAVRESEARYRALVEHAPEAIIVMDAESGKFTDVNANAERMFGHGREKLLTVGPLDISPAMQPGGLPSSDLAWTQIGRCMRGETPVFEWIHTHASGREIPCQIRLSRLPATGRELVRATITDISQQKALEEKIRHADKMAAVGLLAAGVAHEIGNPLLALSMAAQSLEKKSTDEYAQKKLGLIRDHIDRISKIVRQMSDLARPQSLRKTPCDLNRIVERSLEVVRYDKRAREVPIEFVALADAPLIPAVEDQILQVCLNLALNALDAVAPNPPARPKSLRIAVRPVEREGRRFLRACFRDSGPGIPEGSRAKVFQPFFTTKEPGKGTGLGLSVSYRIIEEHRGTLGFDCESVPGTEFFFELPVEEKA